MWTPVKVTYEEAFPGKIGGKMKKWGHKEKKVQKNVLSSQVLQNDFRSIIQRIRELNFMPCLRIKW